MLAPDSSDVVIGVLSVVITGRGYADGLIGQKLYNLAITTFHSRRPTRCLIDLVLFLARDLRFN